MPLPMDVVADFEPQSLAEGSSADPRTVALYCLLFHSKDTSLDREVSDYVIDHLDVLDAVFGPRLQGFAIERPRESEAKDARDEIYERARLYGVGANRLPCAVFLTGIDNRKALRLSFGDFLPPKTKREDDDIALAFRAIAAAAHRTANTSEWRRLASLQRSLRVERRTAYGDRIPPGSQALRRFSCDADAINRIARTGKNLLTLATAAAMLFGGGAVPSGASSVESAKRSNDHTKVTKSTADAGSVKHPRHTSKPARK